MTGQPPLAEIVELRPMLISEPGTRCGNLLHEVEQNLLAGRQQMALDLLHDAMAILGITVKTRNSAQVKSYSFNKRPLQVYTLGRFSMLLNGKPLVFNSRVQEKPIELLKLLISLGGREINKAHVAEILWPDSYGDAANRVLATTLFRLRKLLGKECVFLRAGKLTVNPEYCWVDIWQFEQLLNQSASINGVNNLAAFTKAIELYRGSFLENEDYGWLIPRRERLRQKLLLKLNEIANNLTQENRCEEAIAFYQKALEVDELLENLYLGLMRCFYKLGRHSEAIGIYRRCRETLISVLGIEPGAEMQVLYKEIMQRGML